MFIRIKVLILFLVNMGAIPIVTFSLFDFGILYADINSILTLIVFWELFVGTILLMKYVYSKEELDNQKAEISEE